VVRALDPTLGLRTVGAHDIDVESESARLNCVIPAVCRACEFDTRKMLALSL
jgi:hypothetical protein